MESSAPNPSPYKWHLRPERLHEHREWVLEHHGKQVSLAPVSYFFISYKSLLCLVISAKISWVMDHSHYLGITVLHSQWAEKISFVPDSGFQFYLLALGWQRLVKEGHGSYFNTNNQGSSTCWALPCASHSPPESRPAPVPGPSDEKSALSLNWLEPEPPSVLLPSCGPASSFQVSTENPSPLRLLVNTSFLCVCMAEQDYWAL